MIFSILLAVLTFAAPQSAAPSQSPAATVDAVRALVTAERWDEVDARIQQIPPDDPAWERLGSVVYQAGIARKVWRWGIERLSHGAAATPPPTIKAATLIVVGRADRRSSDR